MDDQQVIDITVPHQQEVRPPNEEKERNLYESECS